MTNFDIFSPSYP